MVEKETLLNVTQVASHLGVSERTVWRYLKKGEIAPPVRIGKGYTRWREKDIFVLFYKQKIGARSAPSTEVKQ